MALDFELSEEHRLVKKTVEDLIGRLGPRREAFTRAVVEKRFPHELWNGFAEAGLFGCVVPEEYGGTGQGILPYAIAMETIGEHCMGNAFLVLTPMDAICIARNASEEVKRRYLPGIAEGKIKFCFAITEPNAGSNAFRLETIAKKDGDGWRLTGQKTFITGADVADRMLIVCRTTSRADVEKRGLPKAFGMAIFIIDPKAKGVDLKPIPTRGIEGMTQFTVHLDDAPAESIVGEPDSGAFALFNSLNPERILVSAQACGIAAYCLKKACDYAKERKLFRGAPIGSYQAIQHPLADSRAKLEAARLLTYQAAWSLDRNDPPARTGALTNMAKYMAAEMAIEAVDRAIETHGGYGFSEEYGLVHLWEGMRLLRTAPVSKEMCLNFIAEHTLGLPRSY